MPQMSPMWWTTIMIFSLLLLMAVTTIVYFYKMESTKMIKMIKLTKFNWKW